jgi:hypothetical protein
MRKEVRTGREVAGEVTLCGYIRCVDMSVL